MGIIGWVPGTGDVGLGVSMFSYRGSVVIGLIADLRLIPDVSRLARLLGESLAALNADI
ncbi:MAG: WS/DGAT domain-containing protein [Candidatus Nanopelagicales bacterium]